MRRKIGAVAIVAVLAVGCGDEETTDRRGYTKAPLEVPALLIDAEEVTEMDRLGTPNRPRGERLEPPLADTTAAGS